MLSNDCRPDENPDTAKINCPLIEFCTGCRILWIRYLTLTITVLVSLFFGAPASILVYVHVKNFISGKTTNERFARAARANSTNSSDRSESANSIAGLSTNEIVYSDAIPARRRRRGYCGNCIQFCC